MKKVDFSKYAEVLAFAKNHHGNQKRKYTDDSYVNHLQEVAQILVEVGASDNVVKAGILHDILEDTDATVEEIQLKFGLKVTNLVLEVTDVSNLEDGNRAVRKAIDRQHLSTASSSAQTVKLADILSNAPSILENDRHFAPIFRNEMIQLLDVLEEGDSTLKQRAHKMFRNEPSISK